MRLSTGEKIKIILGRRGMTSTELAEKRGFTRQNMANKLSKSNFSEKELTDIAEIMNCTFNTQFTMNDTGESI